MNTSTNTQLQNFYEFIQAEDMFDVTFEQLSEEQTRLLSSAFTIYQNFFNHDYAFSIPLKAINDSLTVEDVVDLGHKIHPNVWKDVQKLKTQMDFSDLEEHLNYYYNYTEEDVWSVVDEGEEVDEYLYSICNVFEMDEGVIEYLCDNSIVKNQIVSKLHKDLTNVWRTSQLEIEFTEKLMMDYYAYCENVLKADGDTYVVRPSYHVPHDFKEKLMKVELVFNKSQLEQPNTSEFSEFLTKSENKTQDDDDENSLNLHEFFQNALEEDDLTPEQRTQIEEVLHENTHVQ